MRTEINPYKEILKGKSVSTIIKQKAKVPKKVTICITTHIPNDLGYYRERLKILRLCLDSLRANTDETLYDLLVFNNGSNYETYQFLSEYFTKGKIDYLMNSKENLGVTNSLSIILSMAPGKYICRVDDDVFFKENWLENSIKIIETFPNVGFVTPFPVRSSFNKYYSSAYLTTYKNITGMEYLDQNWKNSWDEIVAYGLGTNLEGFIQNNPLNGLKKLKYKGICAYPLGSHFVSLSKKETIQKILPFAYNDRLIGGTEKDKTSLINLYDKALDDMGYVKLTTDGCYVEHMGNKIDNRILLLKENLLKNSKMQAKFPVNNELTLSEKLLVSIFSLPILRRTPRMLNRFFDKIIFLKKKKENNQ